MVYIVLSGELEVIRMKKNLLQHTEAAENNRAMIGPSKQGKVLSKQEKQSSTQLIRLTYLQSGQMFGEDDLVYGRSCTTTVRCTSMTAVCYHIKKKEFM